ncbi:MAG: hypothetical protein IPJ98_31075 [Bryobacterales bacterium]|nr:hypothetical protein [Bryobacterales bacterium]
MHARGLAQLLRGQTSAAIATLELAAARAANDAGIVGALGLAYGQRGESTRSEADYTKAIELLSDAIRLNPDDTAVLFNRGVLYLRLELHDAAMRDLEACVRRESDPAWRREAEEQLALARKRRGLLRRPEAPGATAEIQLDHWMRTGRLARLGARAGNMEELQRTARLLLERHQDRWLEALLALDGERWGTVITHLSALAEARASMRPELYLALPAEVAALSAAGLPPALAAWRDFEFLFRASHSRTLTGCSPEELPDRARALGFRWLAIQSQLELATCANSSGRLGAGATLTAEASARAREAGFHLLDLRAAGFQTSRFVYEGRYREALRLAASSLRLLLDGGLPVYRAQQFYNDLMRSAEALRRWNVARAAAEMSAYASNQSGYAVLEALARVSLAQYAERTGDSAAANESYRMALAHGQQLEQDANGSAYLNYARAGLLDAQGDLVAFRAMETSLGDSKNIMLAVPYWSRRAALELRAGDTALAAGHARRAMGLLRAERLNAGARMFRLLHEQASKTLTSALLRSGREEEALRVWEEHLEAAWRLADGASDIRPVA